jgi:hypothetical protein
MKIDLKLNFDNISELYKLTQQVYYTNKHDDTGVSYSLARKFQSKFHKIIENNMAYQPKKYKISLKKYEASLLLMMVDEHLKDFQIEYFPDEMTYKYYLNFFRDLINIIHPKL